MTPSTEAITSSLPGDQQGVASALNDLTRELGAALGFALLGGLLTVGYQGTIRDRLTAVPADLATSASEGIANASAASHDAGVHAGQILAAAQDPFVDGWRQAMRAGSRSRLIRGPRAGQATVAWRARVTDDAPGTSSSPAEAARRRRDAGR